MKKMILLALTLTASTALAGGSLTTTGSGPVQRGQLTLSGAAMPVTAELRVKTTGCEYVNITSQNVKIRLDFPNIVGIPANQTVGVECVIDDNTSTAAWYTFTPGSVYQLAQGMDLNLAQAYIGYKDQVLGAFRLR